MNEQDKKLLELSEFIINWHTDIVNQIDNMSHDKVTTIQANVEGEIITLLDDPKRVADVKAGMLLIKTLIEKCPIKIDKENK